MLPVVRTPCVMLWRVIELQQLSRGTMPRGPRAALSWFSTLQYARTTPIQVLALGVPESSEAASAQRVTLEFRSSKQPFISKRDHMLG